MQNLSRGSVTNFANSPKLVVGGRLSAKREFVGAVREPPAKRINKDGQDRQDGKRVRIKRDFCRGVVSAPCSGVFDFGFTQNLTPKSCWLIAFPTTKNQ